MSVQAIIWLALLVVLLAIELLTLGLTTIWFAGGALAAFLAAVVGMNLTVQVILFAAVSVVFLIFTRPFAVKYVNKSRVKTNADSLIGRTAIVTEEINNLAGTGQVQVAGQDWTARSKEEGRRIPSGVTVKIQAISGVKLIVEPCGISEEETAAHGMGQ